MAGGLSTYWRKRDFGKTKEPRGKKCVSRAAPNRAQPSGAFVIQKHDATRLHYDLRLELDGVMMSWAVTRGPSLVPGDKRLAIHVEDHPIEYNKFEGTIPKGEYGGGTVMIWDRGTWIPEHDPHKSMKKGHLDFTLKGKKLNGKWLLVRMRKREGERQEPWLLIKSDDEYAQAKSKKDVLSELPDSVATGRSLEQIESGKSRVWHSNRTAKDQPEAKLKTPNAAKPARALKPAAKSGARPKAGANGRLRAKAKAPGARPASRARTKQASAKKSKAKKRKPALDLASVAGTRKAAIPEFIEPCLAKLNATAPPSRNWIHEIKFDGYRIQARVLNGKVKLFTRKGLDWTDRFPAIANYLAKFAPDDALIDGEIVAQETTGVSDFSALQDDLKTGRHDRLAYYVFDLLHLGGFDLKPAALAERKALLQQFCNPFPSNGPIHFSESFKQDGPVLLDHACRLNLEGIVSKRSDMPYRSGRNGDWIKTKCSNRQEFVIVGYEPSTTNTRSIRSLILAYYDNDALQYAGRVGTGFNERTERDLLKRLRELKVEKAPFAKMPAEERRRKVIWNSPQLVAEIEFRGWTGGNILRQAAFKGLREDKPAKEVGREDQAMIAKSQEKRAALKQATPKRTKKIAAKNPIAKTKKEGKPAAASDFHLTHPDRIYWQDTGTTKQDLANYYVRIWKWIAPHLVDRPLSLVRCPEGEGGECFYQKHISAGLDGKKLKRLKAKGEELMAAEDLDGLIALVQAGTLEVHTWGTTLQHVEQCDRLVFDLDPGPGLGFEDIIEAANDVRKRLKDLKLESFVKTSGGKGLHVVVPIAPADWNTAKDFSHRVALDMARDNPERYTANMAKNRRNKRIFVDYLRNGRGATAVTPYSTRARPGATVSVPVAWNELSKLKAPNTYTVSNLMKMLTRQRKDPWAGIGKLKQKLPA